MLSKIAAKSPPAVIGTYVQVSLKLFALQEKMSKLTELNADEKIQLGNELIEIANTYEQVIAEVRKQIEGTK